MSDKLKVQSVAEFLSSGPAFGSRKEKRAIQAEQVERNASLAQQQRQINNYQKTRSRMTSRDLLEDELKMIREMTENNVETLTAVEAVFEALQKGEA